MNLKRSIAAYFSLCVIIPTLPYTILNGAPEDAVPVQANFDAIVAAVNANAAALASVPPFTGVTAFVPDIKFGGANVGMTYAVQTAAYFRIASINFFSIDVLLTAKGASVGNVTISGLPFAAAGNFPTGSAPTVIVVPRFVTFAAGYIAGLISGTTISLINPVTAATYNVLTDAAIANNSELIITGFYAS